MTQPSVELARCFAFDPFALTEEFLSASKVSGSERRLLKLANKRQQLRELVLVKFFYEQRLLPAFVLQGYLVILTICFSALIHTRFSFSESTMENLSSATASAGNEPPIDLGRRDSLQ